MDNQSEGNNWLIQKDVARYLGISLSQVYWYLRQTPPAWPYYRVTPSKKLTKRADLDAWLEKVMVSAAMPEQEPEETRRIH